MDNIYAYVGAYTTEGDITVSRNAHAKGIKVYEIEQPGCNWRLIQETETLNPAVIILNNTGTVLYSVESDTNCISSYTVESKSGLLSKQSQIHTGGNNTIVIGLSPAGDTLIAADHSGLLSAIKINSDGSLGKVFSELVSPGKIGPLNATFQPHSRPHNIVFSPDGKYCLVPDKGLDKVHVYKVNSELEIFELCSQVDCRRAGCPRHIVFSPNGEFAYLNLELGNAIVAYDFINEQLVPFQIVQTLPESYVGNISKTSEIDIHPSGKWLYVSNRGHDSICAYKIDQENHCLSPIQWVNTAGKIPRFFMVDPSGSSLLCCNQFSDNIAVFAINQHYGTIELRKIIENVEGAVWLQLSGNLCAPDAISAKPGQGLV